MLTSYNRGNKQILYSRKMYRTHKSDNKFAKIKTKALYDYPKCSYKYHHCENISDAFLTSR